MREPNVRGCLVISDLPWDTRSGLFKNIFYFNVHVHDASRCWIYPLIENLRTALCGWCFLSSSVSFYAFLITRNGSGLLGEFLIGLFTASFRL